MIRYADMWNYDHSLPYSRNLLRQDSSIHGHYIAIVVFIQRQTVVIRLNRLTHGSPEGEGDHSDDERCLRCLRDLSDAGDFQVLLQFLHPREDTEANRS